MPVEHGITKNFHPWYGEKDGWDLLEAKSDSEDELSEFISQKERESWKVWIRDNTGQVAVAMYRPHGAESLEVGMNWSDDPEHGLRYFPKTNAGVVTRSADDLRKEALRLLKEAEAIDGLQPVIIMHQHEYGATGYIGWSSETEPSEEAAASVLDAEFEPDRNESLTVETEVVLEELVGVSESSRLKDSAMPAQRLPRM